MQLPTLYTKASSGKLHQWTIEVSGNAYRTHHGYVGGKIVTTEWFVTGAKNVGKANATSDESQAFLEAKAIWQKKVDKGGVQDPEQAVYEAPYIEPMTAQKWNDFDEKRRKRLGFEYPVYIQPKYDGMRAAIARGAATSRGGKSWLTVDHILETLEPMFEEYPDLVLDGELYNHEFKDDFNSLASMLRKQKPTAADLERAREKVQFYWYDIVDTILPFHERLDMRSRLLERFPDLIRSKHVVPASTWSAYDDAQIEETYEELLEEGYEGAMIRLRNLPYEHKRSWSLMKYKPMEDEEFKILEICEGNGNKTGQAAWVWFDNHRVPGTKFKTNVKGGTEFATMLLARKDELVGTWATVQYLNLTPPPALKPRCGFLVKLREGPSKDL